MAKLDLTAIEGYENMTPEQKIAALEGYDIPDPDYSGYVKKTDFDKTASELAEAKKKLKQSTPTEDYNALQDRIKSLEHDKTVSEHKANLLALGYEDALAAETAAAMADGDFAKIFENQKKFADSIKQAAVAKETKGTPPPAQGGGSQTMTLEKFRALPMDERIAFSNDHPDEYKQLYGFNEGGNT